MALTAVITFPLRMTVHFLAATSLHRSRPLAANIALYQSRELLESTRAGYDTLDSHVVSGRVAV